MSAMAYFYHARFAISLIYNDFFRL